MNAQNRQSHLTRSCSCDECFERLGKIEQASRNCSSPRHVKKISGTASSIRLPEARRLLWARRQPSSHDTRRSWIMIRRIAPGRPDTCKTWHWGRLRAGQAGLYPACHDTRPGLLLLLTLAFGARNQNRLRLAVSPGRGAGTNGPRTGFPVITMTTTVEGRRRYGRPK